MGLLLCATYRIDHYLPLALKLWKNGYSVIAIISCESGIDNRDCFQPTNSVCWIFAVISAALRAVTGKKNLDCPVSQKSLRHNRHGHLRLFPVISRSGIVL